MWTSTWGGWGGGGRSRKSRSREWARRAVHCVAPSPGTVVVDGCWHWSRVHKGLVGNLPFSPSYWRVQVGGGPLGTVKVGLADSDPHHSYCTSWSLIFFILFYLFWKPGRKPAHPDGRWVFKLLLLFFQLFLLFFKKLSGVSTNVQGRESSEISGRPPPHLKRAKRQSAKGGGILEVLKFLTLVATRSIRCSGLVFFSFTSCSFC